MSGSSSWFTAEETFTIAASILVSSSNSSVTRLAFSIDWLVTFFTPLTVPVPLSIGSVTSLWTFSGDAPGYVVIIIIYGRFMFGRKSVVILVKLTIPSTSTIITATSTTNGFFTLNFGIVLSIPVYYSCTLILHKIVTYLRYTLFFQMSNNIR